MPSLSTCEEMENMFKQRKRYAALCCELGIFTRESLITLRRIHELRDISLRVRREKEWLTRQIRLPNAQCFVSYEDITLYRNLIFQSPDGQSVLKDLPFILSCDFATLAGTEWLHYIIMG